jgi:ADP-ribosylglycohydrolase
MITLKDKVVGSYYGMAVGNAMGLSVKSLKPETISQLFGSIDEFKDVSPLIGKGIKHFKMRGLYGCQTQSALVIGDCLLQNKKLDPNKISQLLIKMAANGPENYLGTFRHPGKGFFQSISGLVEGSPQISQHNIPDAAFLSMGIPAGLLHRERPEVGIHLNIAIGLIMTRNLCEITGLALTGYLALRLLQLELENNSDVFNQTESILRDAEIFCQKIETQIQKKAPTIWDQTPESERRMLEQTIKCLREQWNTDINELLNWVCQNASEHHKTKIINPAQSHVLSLLPLCLIIVLRDYCGFDSTLTSVLNMGKEADKTGALVGAWAGAIYGWHGIPEPWRSGLVNGKEIRIRGEGLFSRSFSKKAKDVYEMEMGLTSKEFELSKKYFQKATNFTRPTPRPKLSWEDEGTNESNIPEKSDTINRRKFEKDKSKAKKNRRKNSKINEADS